MTPSKKPISAECPISARFFGAEVELFLGLACDFPGSTGGKTVYNVIDFDGVAGTASKEAVSFLFGTRTLSEA